MRRRISWVLAAVAIGLISPVAATLGVTDPTTGDETIGRLILPLEEGRIEAAEVLRALCRRADITPPPWTDSLTWSFDVHSNKAWLQIEALRAITDGAFRADFVDDTLVLELDQAKLETLGGILERGVYEIFNERLEAIEANDRRPFGITIVTDDDPWASPAMLAETDTEIGPRLIVLIHGLDDAGWRWRDAVPALRDAGFVVGRYEYANDGPASDAADLLVMELMDLARLGVTRVDLIGHSLGGLIARDLLTRRAYYDGQAGGHERLPDVGRLILVATPNQGARMALLHGLTEFGEHMHRAMRGDAGWKDFSGDGRGEASVDLLPRSTYLTRLNAKPLPKGVTITIIAGRVSPIGQTESWLIGGLARTLARNRRAPRWMRETEVGSDRAADQFSAMVAALGDGVVSLTSSRLEGVEDYVIRHANHQTLIVNLIPRRRIPPAIPVIIDRLQRELRPAESD